MDLSNLRDYLTIGSYLFGAASWLFLYRELRGVKAQLVEIRVELAREQGIREGEHRERRLILLENQNTGATSTP